MLGRLKGAEADLACAVALAPDSVEARLGHGLFLSAVGRHHEALAALNWARARSDAARDA